MDLDYILNFLEYLGLDTTNLWAIIPQCLTVLPIVWFFYKSIKVIKAEILAEHNAKGAVPILAFIYMVFAIIFTFIFVRNFGEIISYNNELMRNILANTKVITDYYEIYLLGMNSLTAVVLTAFIFNFFKSFFTLNALEFGLLNNISLKSIFNSSRFKAWLEGFLRFVIAFLFIAIEKELAFTDTVELHQTSNSDAFHFQGNNFIEKIGWMTIFLYGATIIWLFLMHVYMDKNEDKKNNFRGWWYTLSYSQYLSGFVVGLIFVWLGTMEIDDGEKIKLLLSGFLVIGLICSIVIVGSIVSNEIIIKKNGAPATV